MKPNILQTIFLGNIGKKADKLQKLFPEYPIEGEYFLKFQYYTYGGEECVEVYTNCFKSKKGFFKELRIKLLLNL